MKAELSEQSKALRAHQNFQCISERQSSRAEQISTAPELAELPISRAYRSERIFKASDHAFRTELSERSKAELQNFRAYNQSRALKLRSKVKAAEQSSRIGALDQNF